VSGETTGHAAKARTLLLDAAAPNAVSPARELLVARAQAHATIALAEEQRTANLIALLAAAQAPAAPGQVGPSLPPALASEIVATVAERLGL
jgi:hypothetical protein